MPSDTILGVTASSNPSETVAANLPVSPFPISPRVIYRQNPLEQVICQLRFSPILRIETELPAAFQELIRDDYPDMKDRTNDLLGLPPNTPAVIATLLRSAPSKQAQTAYDFISADGRWTIGLTREFLSLSTTEYRRWEDFKEHLVGPMAALVGEYKPKWFSRIGLRYQDVITRSKLGLGDQPWSALIKPHMAGILAAQSSLNATVTETFTVANIDFGENRGQVSLRYGLGLAQGASELSFIIDGDYYSEENTEPGNVYNKLDFFNQQSGRLFRWCISDTLHTAMGPEPVEPSQS